ncbi:MAG: DUF2231 domain-containing protein [Gemmatimonadaceae bacterium]|jgi:uncharacterized membrane protein|nr:DUF2231 domain-containing protein [Gemmatimonadaceae bacterium]
MAMQSRARIAGHSIHQTLVPLPIGLLVGSVVFDVLHLVQGEARWALIAFWLIVAGCVTALIASPFGTIDWLAIPKGTRAKRIGTLHMIGNVIVLVIFAVSAWGRRESPETPALPYQLLGFAAIALAGLTAWLGGELVSRLGVGVTPGAHLDAPSSLTHPDLQPADARSSRP